jgi:hypothetical protein
MKKLCSFFLLSMLFACSDGTKPTTTDSDGSSNAVTPLENVNGNIPDTTNSVTQGTIKKGVDSTYVKDSLHKK